MLPGDALVYIYCTLNATILSIMCMNEVIVQQPALPIVM